MPSLPPSADRTPSTASGLPGDDSTRDLPDGADARLQELLERWLDLETDGQPAVPEELCADCPELLEPLRQEIEAVRRVERLLVGTAQLTPGDEEGQTQDEDTQLPTPDQRTSLVGRARGNLPTVAGYEVLRELGRGGMGVVYEARDLRLPRIVALKMIRERRYASQGELHRFKTEAEALASLQHPNIVQIFEVGEHEGLPFFSLEFCAGGSLAGQLDGTPWQPERAAPLVEVLARAIHVAHQARVIHRDLKPQNVLLAQDGTLKITDFGLAKKLDEVEGHTPSGGVLGTPSYMAPEQAAGRTKDIAPASDVYALGAILYELLTGRPPFKSASVWDTLQQVIEAEPVPPGRLNPKVPRDLETICLKCLQKKAAARYETAEHLAEDLRRYQDGRSILARPVGVLERALKWARRQPVAASLVAVSLVAILLAIGGGLLWGLYESEQRSLAELRLQQERDDQARFQGADRGSQGALAAAVAAREGRRWGQVQDLAHQALELAGADPRLAEARGQAEGLLRQAARGTADEEKAVRLRRLHDEVLFHSTPVTPLDRESNVRQVRALGNEAVALFEIADALRSGGVLSGTTFTSAEKADLAGRCFEILVVLAEATATVLSGESASAQARQGQGWLERAAQLRQLGPGPLARLARYLEAQGLMKEAETTRQLARTASPDTLDLWLVGLDEYRGGQLDKAVRSFEASVRGDPQRFWAQFLLGASYLDARRPGEAVLALNACVSQKPDFVWPYLLRGLAQGELGARPNSSVHFQAAEADFSKAATLQPGDSARFTLHVNRGVVCLLAKKPADAVREFEAASKIRPKAYQPHINLAEAHLQMKQWEPARTRLGEALMLNPKLASAYRTRARLLLQPQVRDLAGALKDLEQASACEPVQQVLEVAGDHKERGLILLRLKKPAEALVAFEAALAARPDYVIAYRLKAETLTELNRPADALAAWDVYLPAANRALGKFLGAGEPLANSYRARGLLRSKQGQQAAALEDYHRSLELEADAPTHAYRGWLHVVLDSPRLALRDFEKAIVLDARNADAHSGRGWCLVQLGQHRKGALDAEAAVRLAGKEQRLLYTAARVYAQASVKVRLDPAQQGEPGQELARAYRERALGLLQDALSALPDTERRQQFWRGVVEADSALAPLRSMPVYVRLAEQYRGPA